MDPLKFRPRLKERLWGGTQLLERYDKKPARRTARGPFGESWELSGIDGDLSVVASGPLRTNNLQELIEVYMGDLVGDHNFARSGLLFPVLVKLIDAREALSVQVHPDDALAEQRHNSPGKTEMWYVIDAEPGASLWVGFNRRVDRAAYLDAVARQTLPDLLQRYEVRPGDAFFIPAGTVHALGGGILLAEIQQASDITYRIDDWGRVDASGRPRELHTALAVDAIDFEGRSDYRIHASARNDQAVQLVDCPCFTTNLVRVENAYRRDLEPLDSFVIYLCTEGTVRINGTELRAGETLLIPADTDTVAIEGSGSLLETYKRQ